MTAGIALIQPPFSMPDKPPIGIATLGASLRSKGIPVHALDANIEVFRRLLTTENLDRGEAIGQERLRESPPDQERSSLEMLLQRFSESRSLVEKVFDDPSLQNTARFSLFDTGIQVAMLPFHPERVDLDPGSGYVRSISRWSPYSSRDIVQSLEEPSFLDPHLTDLIPSFLDRVRPELVGISVSFPEQILPGFHCARVVKRHAPDMPVVLGGAFVSCHMRGIRNARLFESIDAIVLDEGETTLGHLLERVRAGERPLGSVIPGVPLPPDEAIAPDYSLFPLDRYLVPRPHMGLLFRLARGCPWGRCTFCSRDIPLFHTCDHPEGEKVFARLRATVESTGVTIYHFTDDMLDPELGVSLSRRIRDEALPIQWIVNIRIDPGLTLDRLTLFREAGCRILYAGIESLNNRILKRMRKGNSVGLIRRVLEAARQAGIPVNAYMIVGFPSETIEEARESFERVLEFRKEGLIRQALYSVFQLNVNSPVGASPSDYDITTIRVQEGDDLRPPTMDFDSSGMSRQDAFRLHREFVLHLKRHPANAGSEEGAEERSGIVVTSSSLSRA